MIEELLPPPVVAIDAFEDAEDGWLFPEEAVLVADAVDKRRREFTTARMCARAALRHLGAPGGPLLRGNRREPVWPPGVVGSITHCDGYRAAAVARRQDVLAIGLDAEPNADLPAGVLNTVAAADEQAWIAEWRSRVPEVCWDRLVFSAKEALYKTWFPMTQRWLDFGDARVCPDGDGGTGFTATVLATSGVPDALRQVSGRWMVQRGLVVTAILVPRVGL